MTTTYPYGLAQAMQTWTTDSFKWVLAAPGGSPSALNHGPYLSAFFSNVAAEFVDASYARQTMTSPAITPFIDMDTPLGEVRFSCDLPSFGVMSDGNTAGWVVLVHNTGSDASSEVVEVYPINYIANGSEACLITLGGGNAIVVSTTCPSNF